ncbi:hypothetical protein WS91_10155 [Burkholderia sp. MSMB1498]|nr:hypothetical protein WS91_10155 [Burkholderia sp. MSMB1498]
MQCRAPTPFVSRCDASQFASRAAFRRLERHPGFPRARVGRDRASDALRGQCADSAILRRADAPMRRCADAPIRRAARDDRVASFATFDAARPVDVFYNRIRRRGAGHGCRSGIDAQASGLGLQASGFWLLASAPIGDPFIVSGNIP